MTMSRTAILCIMLIGLSSPAAARTWYVAKDGTGDYTVIQDAVDHAASGDTIRIGPGRFEEKRPYTSYLPTAEKWTFDVYVAVTVSELTIIGSGADQTIIGPPARIWVDPEEPKVICALSLVSRLVVEDVAMENVFQGVYRAEHGTLVMTRCHSRGCKYGVTTWSERGTLLESCSFQDISYGVISFSPASNIDVRLCTFATCSASFDGTLNVRVSDCQFEGYFVGSQYANGSTGGICNSTFTGQTNVAVVVATGSTVELVNNSLLGGAVNLRLRTMSAVTGSGNVLGGGYTATIRVCNSTMQFRGNHILHGTGPSVLIDVGCYQSPPGTTLDLTNNYWGTDSADTIASWIYDGIDNPEIYGFVQYEPFSTMPLPTEKKSLGGVKGLYR